MDLKHFAGQFVWLRMPTDEEFDSRHGSFFDLTKKDWAQVADRIYVAENMHRYMPLIQDSIAYHLEAPMLGGLRYSWPATHLDTFSEGINGLVTIAKPTSIAEYPKEFLGLSGDFLREHEGKEYKMDFLVTHLSQTPNGPYVSLHGTNGVKWPVCLIKRVGTMWPAKAADHICKAVNIGFTSIKMACKRCGRDM